MKYITYFGTNTFLIEQYLPKNLPIDISFTTHPFTEIPGPATNSLIIVESISFTEIDFDWLRALKSQTPSSPIIIVSDQLNEFEIRESLRSRVRDYVVLPEENEYLTKLIEELFNFEFGSRNGREFSMITPSINKHQLHRTNINATEKALLHIKHNYQQKILVKELADLCRMSSSYFARKFREEQGYTIREFLKRCRINAAMKLLRKTRLTIENIAFDVGFETISLFNRLFKQINGISPSMYRQSINTSIDI